MAGLVTSGLFFTGLAAPRNIYGFLCGLFLDSGMRALVRFGMNRPQSAAGTGLGLNQKSERIEISRSSRLVLNAAVTFLCTGAAAGIIVLAPRATLLVVVLFIWAVGYHFLKPR